MPTLQPTGTVEIDPFMIGREDEFFALPDDPRLRGREDPWRRLRAAARRRLPQRRQGRPRRRGDAEGE